MPQQLSPNHHISGGKVLKRKSRKVINHLSIALRLAARTLRNSKSALGGKLSSPDRKARYAQSYHRNGTKTGRTNLSNAQVRLRLRRQRHGALRTQVSRNQASIPSSLCDLCALLCWPIPLLSAIGARLSRSVQRARFLTTRDFCGLRFSAEFFFQLSVPELDHRRSAVRTTERKVAFEQVSNQIFDLGQT
jgi:hypothetical protein